MSVTATAWYARDVQDERVALRGRCVGEMQGWVGGERGQGRERAGFDHNLIIFGWKGSCDRSITL